MLPVPSTAVPFLLEAFDRAQWCPVLQARFEVPDPQELRAVLGAQADDDPELRHAYSLDAAELAAVVAAFEVRFDPAALPSKETEICLYRLRPVKQPPYLVHGGYELPLLLDGRKKLAKMGGVYPPMTFDGEERFDHWVAEGVLHREVVMEPLARPAERYQGHRTVYYTRTGEEWRIPAMKLIWQAAMKAGGWNEFFERLEGMLFGYEDWQNDWWIDAGLKRGGFGGAPLCCPVTAAGLAWLESAGFRALPPCERPFLAVAFYDDIDPERMRAFLLEENDSVALVRFAMPLWRAREILPLSPGNDRWLVPAGRIPELNRLLRNAVVIADRRDDPCA